MFTWVLLIAFKFSNRMTTKDKSPIHQGFWGGSLTSENNIPFQWQIRIWSEFTWECHLNVKARVSSKGKKYLNSKYLISKIDFIDKSN